jgi:hypothetical protein
MDQTTCISVTIAIVNIQPFKTSSSICTTCSNILEHCILPTDFICVFLTVLAVNSLNRLVILPGT